MTFLVILPFSVELSHAYYHRIYLYNMHIDLYISLKTLYNALLVVIKRPPSFASTAGPSGSLWSTLVVPPPLPPTGDGALEGAEQAPPQNTQIYSESAPAIFSPLVSVPSTSCHLWGE